MPLFIGKIKIDITEDEFLEKKDYSYTDLLRDRPIPDVDGIIIGINFQKIENYSDIREDLWKHLFLRVKEGIPISIIYKDNVLTKAEVSEILGLYRLNANPWLVTSEQEEGVKWLLDVATIVAAIKKREKEKKEKQMNQ